MILTVFRPKRVKNGKAHIFLRKLSATRRNPRGKSIYRITWLTSPPWAVMTNTFTT